MCLLSVFVFMFILVNDVDFRIAESRRRSAFQENPRRTRIIALAKRRRANKSVRVIISSGRGWRLF